MYRIAKTTGGFVAQVNYSPSKPVWQDFHAPRMTEAEARLAAEAHFAARNSAVLAQASVPLVTV